MVLSVPHPAYQEIPVAVVVLNQQVDPSRLLDQLMDRLGCRSVRMLYVAERLPRNDLGKIRRADLLGEIKQLHPSAIA